MQEIETKVLSGDHDRNREVIVFVILWDSEVLDSLEHLEESRTNRVRVPHENSRDLNHLRKEDIGGVRTGLDFIKSIGFRSLGNGTVLVSLTPFTRCAF